MNDERKHKEDAYKENESLKTGDPAGNPNQEHETFDEIPDLDGDGMIGYTGGNFGDTTYTGGNLIQPQPGPVEEASDPEDDEDNDDRQKE